MDQREIDRMGAMIAATATREPQFDPLTNPKDMKAARSTVEIMALVDEYADALLAAVRPDGGIQFAEGLVAKGLKDKLRAAVLALSRRAAP